MELLTRVLIFWLGKYNIPLGSVKLIIEFPERRYADAAESGFMSEMRLLALEPGRKLNGVQVLFATAPRFKP